MSAVWTLESGESVKTLAAWGLNNLRRTVLNQDIDVVEALADGAAFDRAPDFAYRTPVRIFKDGAQWFAGVVTSNPRGGSGVEERIRYTFSGPWWVLDNLPYQQQWRARVSGSLTTIYKSRVILGQTFTGEFVTVDDAIRDVLDYAISKGASLQIGTIEPDLRVPCDEKLDLMCGQIIRSLLRWIPTAVTHFDYSTNPPTLHVRYRSSLATQTIDLAAGDRASLIEIEPRHDLQVPEVVIRYEVAEKVATADGEVSYEKTVEDVWPTGATGSSIGAVVHTVRLQEDRFVGQLVDTDQVPGSLTSTAWWTRWHPWLAAATNIELSSPARSGSRNFANYLTAGLIQDWMLKDPAKRPLGIETERVTFSVLARYRLGSGETEQRYRDHRLEVTLLTLSEDCTGGRKFLPEAAKDESGADIDEPIPVGLARFLYEANSALQWDGQVDLTDEEVAGDVRVGQRLNLANGFSAWATMAAPVQQVSENVDAGVTSIRFGTARHLGPQDLITLLTANRRRDLARSLQRRLTGVSYGP